MRDANGARYLTAARLAELILTLPPDSRVMPNEVHNLVVQSADGTRLVAYVDLAGNGSVEKY